MNVAVSIQTTCDIMVNPHLYGGDEEMSQLIAEEWKGDGVTRIHEQSTSANLDNFERIVSFVI